MDKERIMNFIQTTKLCNIKESEIKSIKDYMALLQKENFNKKELKALGEYYKEKKQESNDTMAYVLTVNTLVLAVAGNVICGFSELETEGIMIFIIAIYIIMVCLATGGVAVYSLYRISRGKYNNCKVERIINALNLLIAQIDADAEEDIRKESLS